MTSYLLNIIKPFSLPLPKNFNTYSQVRGYAIPSGGKTVLTKRIKRKLVPGKTRPAIFYKFDCRVELSDGSTYLRRSQYPRIEWRYLADQRNNPFYNPSRTNLKVVEADATGRLAKFKSKFGFVDSINTTEQMEVTSKPSLEKQQKPSDEKPLARTLMDDYLDLMGEGFVPVQSGGKLAGKRRGKK